MAADEETTPIDSGPTIDVPLSSSEDDDSDFDDFLSFLKPPSDEQNPEEDDVLDQSTHSKSQTDDTIESSEATDIASPAHSNDTDSPTPGNDAASNPSTSSEKLASTPEPPRWRFVNEAKKSMGYSSHNAGSYIEGKSSNELGAEYVTPDVSLDAPMEENDHPTKEEPELSSKESLPDDDIEVGKLAASVPSQNGSSQDRAVGKVQINEVSLNETETIAGEFAGLPKDTQPGTESCDLAKESKASQQLGHKAKDAQDHDQDVHNDGMIPSYSVPNSEASSEVDRDVRKLESQNYSGGEALAAEIAKSNGNEDTEGDTEPKETGDDVEYGAHVIDMNESTDNENDKVDGDSPALTSADYPAPNSEASSDVDRDDGKLESQNHSGGEALAAESAKSNGDEDTEGDTEPKETAGDIEEGAQVVHTHESANNEHDKVDGSKMKNRLLVFVALIFLALLTVFVVVLLGNQKTDAGIGFEPLMSVFPTDKCGVYLRLYSSSSNCVTGFSSKHSQLYSIIADGECHNSGREDLGYYTADCGTNSFQMSRSGCTDGTCSECDDSLNEFSGEYQEEGCMAHWSVSDLDKTGSLPFTAVADGECNDSGIDGIGHYIATCDDDGDWFQLARTSCADETCSNCTGTSGNFTMVEETARKCKIDSFYREQVWSIVGSCQRPTCSGSTA